MGAGRNGTRHGDKAAAEPKHIPEGSISFCLRVSSSLPTWKRPLKPGDGGEGQSGPGAQGGRGVDL